MTIREKAKHVSNQLIENGFTTYFAGGCVRDQLLGLEPNDYDIATSATPDQVLDLFPNSDMVGKHFGVVIVKYLNEVFEVATFRTDGCYNDNRRPDNVTFSTPEEDAKRRDFTINAMFQNPNTDEIIDFVGGKVDIENKLIRCVGNPKKIFEEDALRIMRLFRFDAQLAHLEFAMERDTLQSAVELKGNLRDISKERIGQEIIKILKSKNPICITTLYSNNIINHNHNHNHNNLIHLLPYNDEVVEDVVPRLRNLCMTVDHMTKLRLPSTVIKKVVKLDEFINDFKHNIFAPFNFNNLSKFRKYYGHKLVDSALSTGDPILVSLTEDIDNFKRMFYLFGVDILPKPIINGQILIDMGLTPNKEFKNILDNIYDIQLESISPTLEELKSKVK